jgi:predicted ATPase
MADVTLDTVQRSHLEASGEPEQLPATTIDRFSVIAKIGEGGMGQVFLAHDPQLGRKVAIKLLRSHHGDARAPLGVPSEMALKRLIREAQGLARVSHPNVVQVYQIGEQAGAVFIAMEYVRGSTLHAWSSTSRSWRAIVEVLVQCGRGLEAAHRAALIHRDFKPANVMVGSDGRVRVLDFGLARDSRVEGEASPTSLDAAGPLQTITEDSVLMGTPAYMAPEQLLGGRCDALSDQFSFCAVAFEALIGQRPLAGGSVEELRAAVVAGRILAMPEGDELPRRLREAITRGLALEPGQRWPSMSELLEQLDVALADAGLRAYLRQRETSDEAVEPAGPTAVRIPDRLYGRGRELGLLHAAFAAVAERRSPSALLVVRGEAGVGKSALVRELQRSLAGPALIGSAKFDQLQLVTPLIGFIEAFEQLVEQLVDEPDESLAARREAILAGVGGKGQLLVDLVPGLGALLGPQPPVALLGGAERLNRFRWVVERFVGALASPSRPLVLFLDDLQWADPDSLALLEHLLASTELDGLVMIVALRPSEAEAARVLGMIDRAPDRIRIEQVELGALTIREVAALLADGLNAGTEQVAALASVVVEKTGGNPFFVQQFVQALCADSLIQLDAGSGAWSWSMERIAERPLVDDVVALLAGRLDALPNDTRRLLQIAGCIGNRFALGSLASVVGGPPTRTLQALWPALAQGLLTLDGEPMPGLGALAPDVELELAPEQADELVLRFRHDRIQTAACSTLAERERAAIHLDIGRTLLATLDGTQRRARAFELADQLNIGRSLIQAPDERRALVELDLECGRRALHSAAYASASEYLEVASELLEAPNGDPQLWFTVELERARALYLDGRYEAADAIHPVLLAAVTRDDQRLAVYELQIEQAMLSSGFEAGFVACRAAFGLYGLELPERDDEALPIFAAELAAIEARLAGIRIEDLRDVAELADERQRSLLHLLNRFGVLTYRTARPILLAWAIAKMTDLSMSGRSLLAGYSYSNFGFLLAVQGDLARAGAFGQLGLELARDYGDPVMLARTTIVALGLVGHFEQPLAQVADELHRSFPACIEAGDLMHASDLLLLGDYAKLAAGQSLTAVFADIEAHLGFFRRSAPAPLASFYVPHLVFLTCALIDRPLASLGIEFDSATFLARYSDSAIAQAWHYSALTKLEVLLGEWRDPEELLRRVAIVEAGVTGQMQIAEVRYYAALGLLGSPHPPSDEQLGSIDRWCDQLRAASQRCATNYRAKLLLLEAERARVRGDSLESTIDRYEQALDEAANADALDQEALVARRFGQFWLARGHRRSGEVHLRTARDLYERWGATRIVATLR